MMLCESFGYEMFARGVDHEDHCWGSVQPTDHAWKRRTVLRICQALGIKRGIAGILVQWILADPEDRLARQDLFVEFASKLCDNSPEVADLVRACREFFDLHFSATPELLEKAHRSLDAWQAKQPA